MVQQDFMQQDFVQHDVVQQEIVQLTRYGYGGCVAMHTRDEVSVWLSFFTSPNTRTRTRTHARRDACTLSRTSTRHTCIHVGDKDFVMSGYY